MEREIKNNKDIDTSLSNELREGLAASEMADRGPKAINTTKNDWPGADGKASLMGVSNPGKEASDEDEDNEEDEDEDDIDFDDNEDVEIAEPAVAGIESTEIDNIDDDDLDIELDEEEEEEDI